jgi:hypothetical protein
MKYLIIIMLIISLSACSEAVPEFEPNYDERLVPSYTLPDPLVTRDGIMVTSPDEWRTKQRPEILALFEREMFGAVPESDVRIDFRLDSVVDSALEGRATRKLVTLVASGNGKILPVDLLIYLPNYLEEAAPVFLGLNFRGNHTIHPDPAIPLAKSWITNDASMGITDNRANEQSRGARAHRWPVEKIIDAGYGLATIYYGDIDPDFDDGFQNGIHALFHEEGQKPGPNEWGSIAAWAWGLSRALDYLQQDEDVDGSRVAVMGHSRLGKTSLWAGAIDERFALVISNNSGCGGAALSKRAFGETVGRINTSFPHWFADAFTSYNEKEEQLSFDQHMLIALMAPRPVYVASAEEDRWADPRGEFLAALAADPAYRLLGTDGMAADEMPPVGSPVHSRIGYHIRSGGHNVTDYDWEQWFAFANKHLGGER